MAKKEIVESIEVPEGISVSREDNSLIVNGPKGSVTRKFDNPNVSFEVKDRAIIFTAKSSSKKEKAVVHAYRAHIRNAFAGCEEHFVYKLKVCSGHFPMNISMSGDTLVIKNFLGEKVPRKVRIKEGAKVKVDGSHIVVEGPDKELVGQVAADIEQATRRPGFDKRIFQDGIYITDKAGKMI
ncbi:50S ribosomal protein L6 [Candidatus Woesearchaeota archaeon]|nr:50S ribosomal protein L6 [Candidatus Woesearchaeota archaeon]